MPILSQPAAPKPYEYQPFPSVRYHRSGKTAIVKSQEEHDALDAAEWADTPAAFAAEAPAASDDTPGTEGAPAPAKNKTKKS